MSTRFSKAYLLVPVVYVGVIFGLLFLQFSGGERFSRSVGPLWLRATRDVTSESGEPTVRGLTLEFNGLRFDFADQNGLIVETNDDILDVPVRGFTQIEGGFLVDFEGGYLVEFIASEEPVTELQVRVQIPDTETGIRDVALPFEFAGTSVPESAGRASFVSVSRGNEQYYLTAPPDALIDSANEKVVIQPAASNRAIRYVEATAGNPQAVLEWFADGANQISTAEYRQTIEQFVDRAYSGWASGRYAASTLTWESGSGASEFSESALTAYLAEAWRRNEFDRAYAEMRRAVDLYPDELGLLSSAYLGNLREVRERFIARDQAAAAEIRDLLASGETTLFRRPNLYLFAADRGSEALYGDLLQYTQNVDLRLFDVTTAVRALANHVLAQHPEERSREVSSRFVELINTHLLGSIVRNGDLFFLQSAPGQIDVELSAIAGASIAAYGEASDESTLVAAGRNLVRSVLSLADQDGMLPASLVVRGESVEQEDGLIPPEILYPYLSDNPNYPRELSLYDLAGAGTWMWTVVNVRPVVISQAEWRFRLEYPRLRTHYLIIQGVPEFSRLELFGQTWRNAPDFEIYSKGRHYNPDSNTLMIKYYDDSVARDIAIFLP